MRENLKIVCPRVLTRIFLTLFMYVGEKKKKIKDEIFSGFAQGCAGTGMSWIPDKEVRA